MPAYVRHTVAQFVQADATAILGSLQQEYAADGFASQYTRQTKAWSRVIPKLQGILTQLLSVRSEVQDWTVLLEYPLYRLRRRIDIVILAGGLILVIECKVAANAFTAEDRRQVEEYALDLRDFHAESHTRPIIPVLWNTDMPSSGECDSYAKVVASTDTVAHVVDIGGDGLQPWLEVLATPSGGRDIVGSHWDRSTYRPVPNVIEAATSIFAGHDVRSIANADADNLESAARRILQLIDEARAEGKRYLLILTGVPGSGKTLAGLHVVHSAIATGIERPGDIVYLSGNTPLVVVLREALARDEHVRQRRLGRRRRLGDIRRDVRARIQHINDFLQESIKAAVNVPPHEHVIIFDEAQRAWDEKHGLEKFDRTASEPALILELMSRHLDWCVCLCLVGSGQEINSGENGVFGWGEALRGMQVSDRKRWAVFAPPDVLRGNSNVSMLALGQLPDDLKTTVETNLQLTVPQRSYRSPSLCRWVDLVLAGDALSANIAAEELEEYPIVITRSLAEAKSWLQKRGRGERRFGLVASSGARRLRADGIGVFLHASAGHEIAQWYLEPPDDIRSSYALEVPANEYTCQGLELDFVGVCWGGDLLWSASTASWIFHRLSGTDWQRVRQSTDQRFLLNSYRVLLTRAREGLVFWVPEGNPSDRTRLPGPLDDTANYLERCGAKLIGAEAAS
jgi:hypothetical protein